MIKRSLVVIDASPRSELRLELALGLARAHVGELTALYGVMPSLLATPWASSEGVASAAGLMMDLDQQQRDRAREVFQRVAQAGPAHWLDGGDMPYAMLLRQAFVHDLLVLGQHDADDDRTGALPPDLVSASILDSGRPALVVPALGRFASTDGPVLVAWKATREAARAVSAALPWLRRAPQVHVATHAESDSFEPPLPALEHWMALQGVVAPVQRHSLGEGDVGTQLLRLASDLGAALLVMGCYGHSRAREWVLGGATRKVLRTMTLPVLLAH